MKDCRKYGGVMVGQARYGKEELGQRYPDEEGLRNPAPQANCQQTHIFTPYAPYTHQ